MLARAAKPLPTSLGIGVDVTRLSRFSKLVDKYFVDGRINLWARKVLNVLEYPDWDARVEAFRSAKDGVEQEQKKALLVRFMAGRWALKEAAIKAHSYRKLFYRDVSILAGTGKTSSPSSKPCVLIDPPRQLVVFTDEVANKRGINKAIKDIRVASSLRVKEACEVPRDPKEQTSHGVTEAIGVRSYSRWRLIEMEHRQLADGSISHDGDYVVAACQALNDPHNAALPSIQDHGSGKSIHMLADGDWDCEERGYWADKIRG